MEKKYQVFISSTFTDLKDERKAVIECLLNAKYIPAGMEMFSASNDEQFKYIKKIINNCDYYILILGGRYGTINSSTKKSFTEMEYEYAKEQNIPILAFPIDDISNLPDNKKDHDLENINKFRATVMSSQKLCKAWRSTPELIGGILNSLAEAISDNPRSGWTRGNSFDYDDLLEQINYLQIENKEYSSRVKKLEACLDNAPTAIENLADGDELFEIRIRRRDCDDKIQLTWDKIFSLIGPYLNSPKDEQEYIKNAKFVIRTQLPDSQNIEVYSYCLQTIKYQFRIRGLISVLIIKDDLGKQTEEIELTKKGRDYLNQVISVKTTKNLETATNIDDKTADIDAISVTPTTKSFISKLLH